MSRREILDFQARWMRPAGIVAILAGALLVASFIVGSVGSADDNAEQLLLYQDHAGRFITASVISGIGLLLVGIPLYFLFRSARARAEQVRSFAGPLLAVGAVLVCVQGVVFSLGFKDASDSYVSGVAAVEAKARQAPSQATTTTGTTTTGTATQPKTTEQRVSDARDDFATDEINDASKVKTGRLIGLFGSLALIAGAIYTLVWSMRTGLLSRFMATIGMVFLGALLLIPSLGPVGMVLWFAVLGLMLAGWWIRPLPPAWAAGEAVPWPRPGGQMPPGEGAPPGTVEGSGREVAETPLPENGATEQQLAETPGQRRKKRKRRK